MKTIFFAIAWLLCLTANSQGPAPRAELNLDQVYTDFGLDGSNTLVVIIDRGIDYQHPDFIDSEGQTRIAYIYDMVDPTGAEDVDNPYGIGTIFDEDEINAALQNGGDPITMDWYGHGTATTGITAGNGSAIASGIYHGVAPAATIIAIKVTLDPFPPFDTNPGQTGFFNPAYIGTALEFAHDKAVELGLPTVALLNLGSTGGSTDGTSIVCQQMDAFVAQGHSLVCGVGDDGGGDNHAQATVNQGETLELVINKGDNFNLRLDLWYSEDDRFTISVERPDLTIAGPYTAPADASSSSDWFEADFNLFHRGADVEFSQASSYRRELLIDLFGAPGTYKIMIEGANVVDGEFHATLNPGNFYSNNGFESYTLQGFSIADYATAFDILTPTDYVIVNEWTDIDGIPRSIVGQGDPGEIWIGSSMGPTHDGRLGVELAIPGEVCFAAYSDGTYYGNFNHNKVQDGEGFYGVQNAVSAAAPQLAGIVALMLEVNPDLSPAQIKEVLEQSCIQDTNTGPVPNPLWGFGKLDAYAAIQGAADLVGIQTSNQQAFSVYPNPASEILNVSWNGSEIPTRIEIHSIDGRFVRSISFEQSIDIRDLQTGTYVVHIVSENSKFTQLFVKSQD